MREDLDEHKKGSQAHDAVRKNQEKAKENGGESDLTGGSKPPVLRQADLKKDEQKIGQYLLGKTIGEGTFGKVKLGTHILTGEKVSEKFMKVIHSFCLPDYDLRKGHFCIQVAIKILEKSKISDNADVERVSREIHILKVVRHPHVVQLYEIIETPKKLYLIMEFASGGELFDYIVKSVKVDEEEACRFFQQIISGVEYIS